MRQKGGCRAQKNRAAAWHMGISLRELQKRLLNRQGAFLSFNNASACRSLFVRSLCGLSSSSLPAAQYPYPCFHPFFWHTDIVRDTKRFLSPIHRASTQAAIPVARQIENGVFVHKGEILTSVADFDSFPCLRPLPRSFL